MPSIRDPLHSYMSPVPKKTSKGMFVFLWLNHFRKLQCVEPKQRICHVEMPRHVGPDKKNMFSWELEPIDVQDPGAFKVGHSSTLKSDQAPKGSRIVFQVSFFRGELLNFGGVTIINIVILLSSSLKISCNMNMLHVLLIICSTLWVSTNMQGTYVNRVSKRGEPKKTDWNYNFRTFPMLSHMFMSAWWRNC